MELMIKDGNLHLQVLPQQQAQVVIKPPISVELSLVGLRGPTGPRGETGIGGRDIVSALVDASGDLILHFSDASSLNVGHVVGSTVGGTWGLITGNLGDQSDLIAALDSKASAAQGAKADAAIPAAEKGAINGVATLNSSGQVPTEQLPSFVDDVLEYASFGAFPGTGEIGKIYVALDTNKTWRWGGSAYVEITASPGSTDAVTEGATNLYFTADRVRSVVLSGLSLADSALIAATDTVLGAIGKLAARLALAFDRTNHTGTQVASTISDFASAARAQTEAELVAGTNITLTPSGSGATRQITISASGGGSGMTNPMTTAGDIITGGASGVAQRLAAGVNGQRLTMVGGAPAWAYDLGATITESTTARNATLTDVGNYLRHVNASASTLTIPPQSSVAWPDDAEIHVRRAAAGNLTLTPGSGVTLNAPSGGTLVMSNAMTVTLKRVAADVWDVIGQTVAA